MVCMVLMLVFVGVGVNVGGCCFGCVGAGGGNGDCRGDSGYCI